MSERNNQLQGYERRGERLSELTSELQRIAVELDEVGLDLGSEEAKDCIAQLELLKDQMFGISKNDTLRILDIEATKVKSDEVAALIRSI